MLIDGLFAILMFWFIGCFSALSVVSESSLVNGGTAELVFCPECLIPESQALCSFFLMEGN